MWTTNAHYKCGLKVRDFNSGLQILISKVDFKYKFQICVTNVDYKCG